jgi:phage terminase large subunit
LLISLGICCRRKTMEVNLREDINDAYIPAFQDTHRILLLYGGAGAGKSYAGVQKTIVYGLLNRGKKILYVRKTLPSLKLTTKAIFENLMSKYNLKYHLNKSDLTGTFNRNTIIFKSIDDPEKIKSITDVDMILIEELTELKENEFRQLNLRLRGERTSSYRQIIGIFNPIAKSHWLYKKFFARKQPDVSSYKFTYKDNKFIDPEYVKVLERLKDVDENSYKVYALGEWGEVGQLVYTNWVVEEFDVPEDANFYNGVDFGWVHPSVYLMMFEKDGEIWIYDEVYQSYLQHPEFVALAEKKHEFWKTPKIIYADPAEPDGIAVFENKGFIAEPVNKRDKVSQIHALQRFKIHIHPRCVHTIEEIEKYKFMTDRHGEILETPVKFKDDAMDALQYGSYNHLRDLIEETNAESDKLEFI